MSDVLLAFLDFYFCLDGTRGVDVKIERLLEEAAPIAVGRTNLSGTASDSVKRHRPVLSRLRRRFRMQESPHGLSVVGMGCTIPVTLTS